MIIPYLVDIIVIGYNEGSHLDRCLNAVIESAKKLEKNSQYKTNIIYVDSFSTDNSGSISKNRNIRVVFAPKLYHTCSNARTTGFILTSGKYVMFLDGDMEIAEDWLVSGVHFLNEHNNIAGVAGIRDDMRLLNGKHFLIKNYNKIKKRFEFVKGDIGGAFLYRREALNQVGGFEPSIAPEEDYVLYCQLKIKGWEMCRINEPMIIHWDTKISSPINLLIHTIFSRRSTVSGAILRYSLFHTDWGFIYLWKFKKNILVHLFWLDIISYLFFSIFFLKSKVMSSVLCMIIFSSVYFSLLIFEKKDFVMGTGAIFLRTAYLFNLLIGFVFNYPQLSFGIQFQEDYINAVRTLNKDK